MSLQINSQNISKLKFDDKGLIPAIVQHYETGDVLTLAYMNAESLEITLREKSTCFFSRSRNELWRKGETSGNTQEVISIIADCDYDSLLVKVNPAGNACHLDKKSCFDYPLCDDDGVAVQNFSVNALYEMLCERNEKRPEGSYTTYLFEKGVDKILKKIGEECTEVIVATKNNDEKETVYEIADLMYHVMVLMVERGISVLDIKEELAGRNVIEVKVKQEKMC